MLAALSSGSSARRDEANGPGGTGFAVNDDERSQGRIQADEEEALLGRGMIWIRKQDRVVIREDGRSVCEADAVLAKVGAGLRGVLREVQVGHGLMYIQCTAVVQCCAWGAA